MRFCGLPEALELDVSVRRNNTATWQLAGDLANFGRDSLRAAIQLAFDTWSGVANCSAKEASPGETPDLILSTVRLDGPQGVLADCELPGPTIQHLRMDTSEKWIIQLGPGVPQGKIDIERVLTHELGHFWGIGHISNGNLMAPTYSTSIDKPQSGDVQEITSRYGPPQTTPVPPTPGDVDLPDQMVIIGKSGRETARFKLTRIG